MSADRRQFLSAFGKLLILTPAAAAAWEYVEAGKAEEAPSLPHCRPLVGDDDRHREVHRLRGLRSRRQERERRSRRARVLPHLGGALSRAGGSSEHPEVDSPNGGFDGFTEQYRPGDGSKSFFVPKLCNACADSTGRPGLPGGRDV